MYLQVFELTSADDLDALDWFKQLRQSAWIKGDAAGTVAQIIEDVDTQGDKAVVRYMKQWTNPDFAVEDICVSPGQLAEALRRLDGRLRKAFEAAIGHVRAYQQHIKPVDPETITIGDAELGLRFTPVPSVGLVVPGGKRHIPRPSLCWPCLPWWPVSAPNPSAWSRPRPPRRAGEKKTLMYPRWFWRCARCWASSESIGSAGPKG